MPKATVTPEVRSVLERCTITDRSVKLPEQLNRKLYDLVNRVLVNAGGAWNRKAGCHLFPGDPRPKLGLALESGELADEKQELGMFFTPPALADLVARVASVRGRTVLEPSAGRGALLRPCLALGAAEVLAVEIHPENCRHLAGVIASAQVPAALEEADFLSLEPEQRFDRVVMNPPFSRGEDLRHVARARCWVKPGGRLVAVIAGNLDRQPLKNLMADDLGSLERLPDGSFTDAGTGVRTALLTLEC